MSKRNFSAKIPEMFLQVLLVCAIGLIFIILTKFFSFKSVEAGCDLWGCHNGEPSQWPMVVYCKETSVESPHCDDTQQGATVLVGGLNTFISKNDGNYFYDITGDGLDDNTDNYAMIYDIYPTIRLKLCDNWGGGSSCTQNHSTDEIRTCQLVARANDNKTDNSYVIVVIGDYGERCVYDSKNSEGDPRVKMNGNCYKDGTRVVCGCPDGVVCDYWCRLNNCPNGATMCDRNGPAGVPDGHVNSYDLQSFNCCECTSPAGDVTSTSYSPGDNATGVGLVQLNGTSRQLNVTLDWGDVSEWGTTCGTGTNIYQVYLSGPSATCDSLSETSCNSNSACTWEPSIGSCREWNDLPSGCTNPQSSSCTLSDLKIGTTYKWKIVANNGCKAGTSSTIHTFTTDRIPEIGTAQIGITAGIYNAYVDNCNSYKNTSSCYDARNYGCTWNAVKSKCQMYVSENGDFKNFLIKTTYTDTDNGVNMISTWLDTSNTWITSERSYPTHLYNGVIMLAGNSSGQWAVRGADNINNTSVPKLCGCSIAERLSKNCDDNIPDPPAGGCVTLSMSKSACINQTGCYWNGSCQQRVKCSTVTDPYSCTSTIGCGWNSVDGFCHPIEYVYGGMNFQCKDSVRGVTLSVPYGWDSTPETYWGNGAKYSDISICSLGNSLDDSSVPVSSTCSAGGFMQRVDSITFFGSTTTVETMYSVINDPANNISSKLYLHEHVEDPSGVVQYGSNLTYIGGGCPSGLGSRACYGWSIMRSDSNVPQACVRTSDGQSDCSTNAFEIYVDNNAPTGSISSEMSSLNAARLTLSAQDGSFGGDGGGLKAGSDGMYDLQCCKGIATACNTSSAVWSSIGSGVCSELSASGSCTHDAGALSASCKININGLDSGASYSFRYTVEDLAGNIYTTLAGGGVYVSAPWIKTVSGDMYAFADIDIRIQTGDDFLSSFTAYTGGSIPNPSTLKVSEAKNNTSNPGFVKTGYDTRYFGVYSTLYEVADYKTTITPISDANSLYSGPSGVYTYSGGTLGPMPSGAKYTGVKVVFVPGSITISPDILPNNETDDALLFIVGGDLTIAPTSSIGIWEMTSPVSYDRLYAAFIVQGNVNIQQDDNKQLRIKGFVFANGGVTFGRDLGVYNSSYPAEMIIYDPRYMDLMEQFLGREKIENFTCGVVADRSECSYDCTISAGLAYCEND